MQSSSYNYLRKVQTRAVASEKINDNKIIKKTQKLTPSSELVQALSEF